MFGKNMSIGKFLNSWAYAITISNEEWFTLSFYILKVMSVMIMSWMTMLLEILKSFEVAFKPSHLKNNIYVYHK